jgi:hypothetical protein
MMGFKQTARSLYKTIPLKPYMTEDSTSNKQYISYLESVTNNYKETDKP